MMSNLIDEKLPGVINQLERSYLLKRPNDAELIRDIMGSFRYAIEKLKKEGAICLTK